MSEQYTLNDPIVFKSDYDGEITTFTTLRVEQYMFTNNIAVILETSDENPEESVYLSTNIRSLNNEDKLFALNVNDTMVDELTDQLIEKGILEYTDIPSFKSGFVTYPVVKLTVNANK